MSKKTVYLQDRKGEALVPYEEGNPAWQSNSKVGTRDRVLHKKASFTWKYKNKEHGLSAKDLKESVIKGYRGMFNRTIGGPNPERDEKQNGSDVLKIRIISKKASEGALKNNQWVRYVKMAQQCWSIRFDVDKGYPAIISDRIIQMMYHASEYESDNIGAPENDAVQLQIEPKYYPFINFTDVERYVQEHAPEGQSFNYTKIVRDKKTGKPDVQVWNPFDTIDGRESGLLTLARNNYAGFVRRNKDKIFPDFEWNTYARPEILLDPKLVGPPPEKKKTAKTPSQATVTKKSQATSKVKETSLPPRNLPRSAKVKANEKIISTEAKKPRAPLRKQKQSVPEPQLNIVVDVEDDDINEQVVEPKEIPSFQLVNVNNIPYASQVAIQENLENILSLVEKTDLQKTTINKTHYGNEIKFKLSQRYKNLNSFFSGMMGKIPNTFMAMDLFRVYPYHNSKLMSDTKFLWLNNFIIDIFANYLYIHSRGVTPTLGPVGFETLHQLATRQPRGQKNMATVDEIRSIVLDFLKEQLLVVPHSGNHWICLQFELQPKEVQKKLVGVLKCKVYDSFGRSSEDVERYITTACEKMMDIVNWIANGEETEFDGFTYAWTPNAWSKQKDGYNCGIFACRFLQILSVPHPDILTDNELELQTQKQIKEFRLQMANSIANYSQFSDSALDPEFVTDNLKSSMKRKSEGENGITNKKQRK